MVLRPAGAVDIFSSQGKGTDMSDEYRQLEDQPSTPPPDFDPGVQAQVNGPAIGLMATGGIGIVGQLAGLVINLLGAGLGTMAGEGGEEKFESLFSGALAMVSAVLGVIVGAFIIFGGLKMKNLESYGLAVATAIIAMVPCFSPCCVIGLPVGIWALFILMKPEVKAAFR